MAHTLPKTLWCWTGLVAPYNINVQIDGCHHFVLQTQNVLFWRPIRSTKHVFYVNVHKTWGVKCVWTTLTRFLKSPLQLCPSNPLKHKPQNCNLLNRFQIMPKDLIWWIGFASWTMVVATNQHPIITWTVPSLPTHNFNHFSPSGKAAARWQAVKCDNFLPRHLPEWDKSVSSKNWSGNLFEWTVE